MSITGHGKRNIPVEGTQNNQKGDVTSAWAEANEGKRSSGIASCLCAGFRILERKGVEPARTRLAESMSEVSFGVIADVHLELFPAPLFVSDLFTG